MAALTLSPLALNVTQARAMRDKAGTTGVINMAFFTFRWVPLYLRLKQFIEEGYIADVVHSEDNAIGIFNQFSIFLFTFL